MLSLFLKFLVSFQLIKLYFWNNNCTTTKSLLTPLKTLIHL